MEKPSKQTVGEAVRFGITGAAATAVHYGVYMVLHGLMNVSAAYTVGYVVSFALNYVLSARFTFRKQASARNGAGFAAAHAFNYLLQVSLLNVFIWLGVSKAWAPVPVYCVAVPTNFVVVRLVFKRMSSNGQGTENKK